MSLAHALMGVVRRLSRMIRNRGFEGGRIHVWKQNGKIERAIEKKDARKLIALTESCDKDIYLAAITGLGKVGGDDAANYLTTLIQNAEPDTRIAVALALGMIGDMHTKAVLSAQLSKETEPKVREAIGAAMSGIKDY
jgi:HEAT repeat protein